MPEETKKKLRVCAYCRVSTDEDTQATSYELQVQNYTKMIHENPKWEFVHMPPQKCNLTADDGASPPPEWCTASAEMVHGGRERGAPDRHAGNYSGMPLRFRMDSPSIWMV